jgi:hypothetical protein
MQGIPKQFNTRQDIENCLALAEAGEIDHEALKNALTVLLGDEKAREVSQSGVATDYAPAAGETIVEEKDMITGDVVRNVLVEVDNLNSRLRLALEMTPTELNAIIGGL